MKMLSALAAVAILPACLLAAVPEGFETDVLPTSQGDLRITFLGHGTLMFQWGGKTIHVDPVSRYADYARLPKADLILVTHEHGDHLDKDAIEKITTPATALVATKVCCDQLGKGQVMRNGDVRRVAGLSVRAVPAYNIVHKRPDGDPFHPKGNGNGYVVTFGKQRVYIAGDTENIPEMKDLKQIDIAFLPMNLPYTMTPEMVADAARVFAPKILYPYHYGQTDPNELVKLLADDKNIEVRIRKMR